MNYFIYFLKLAAVAGCVVFLLGELLQVLPPAVVRETSPEVIEHTDYRTNHGTGSVVTIHHDGHLLMITARGYALHHPSCPCLTK